MAQTKSPSSFDNLMELVDPDSGKLTDIGLNRLVELWRQVVAGFVNVPCVITQASVNVLVLTPVLNKEGGASIGSGMAFSGKAVATSTGLVTAQVASLPAMKVYKNNGAAQANTGDIVNGSVYSFLCDMSLDAGNGGLIIPSPPTAPYVNVRYESPQTTIALSTPITLAHGLGVQPKRIFTYMVCQTADGTFSPGEWITIGHLGVANNSIGISVKVDATNATIHVSSVQIDLMQASGTQLALTLTRWKIVLVAEP